MCVHVSCVCTKQNGKSFSGRIQLLAEDLDSAVGIHGAADVQPGEQKATEEEQNVYRQTGKRRYGKRVSVVSNSPVAFCRRNILSICCIGPIAVVFNPGFCKT